MRHQVRAAAIVVGLAALSGCGSDPAAEAPVNVQPGLYAASLGGRAFGPFYAAAPKELDKKVCVYPEDVETFPQMYARKYLSMEDACGGELAERVGNRITGKVTCPLDKGELTGRLVTRFEGDVAQDSITVRAVTKLEDLQGDPGQVASVQGTPLTEEGIDLMLKITRVGDCVT